MLTFIYFKKHGDSDDRIFCELILIDVALVFAAFVELVDLLAR